MRANLVNAPKTMRRSDFAAVFACMSHAQRQSWPGLRGSNCRVTPDHNGCGPVFATFAGDRSARDGFRRAVIATNALSAKARAMFGRPERIR